MFYIIIDWILLNITFEWTGLSTAKAIIQDRNPPCVYRIVSETGDVIFMPNNVPNFGIIGGIEHDETSL